LLFAKNTSNLILEAKSANFGVIMAGALVERVSSDPNLERAVNRLKIDPETIEEILRWDWKITPDGSRGLRMIPPLGDSSKKPFGVFLEVNVSGDTLGRAVPVGETASEAELFGNHRYNHYIRDPEISVFVDTEGARWIRMEGPDSIDALGGQVRRAILVDQSGTRYHNIESGSAPTVEAIAATKRNLAMVGRRP